MVYPTPIRINAWVARSGQPGQAPAGGTSEAVEAIKEARLAIEGVPDTWRSDPRERTRMQDQERGE